MWKWKRSSTSLIDCCLQTAPLFQEFAAKNTQHVYRWPNLIICKGRRPFLFCSHIHPFSVNWIPKLEDPGRRTPRKEDHSYLVAFLDRVIEWWPSSSPHGPSTKKQIAFTISKNQCPRPTVMNTNMKKVPETYYPSTKPLEPSAPPFTLPIWPCPATTHGRFLFDRKPEPHWMGSSETCPDVLWLLRPRTLLQHDSRYGQPTRQHLGHHWFGCRRRPR